MNNGSYAAGSIRTGTLYASMRVLCNLRHCAIFMMRHMLLFILRHMLLFILQYIFIHMV